MGKFTLGIGGLLAASVLVGGCAVGPGGEEAGEEEAIASTTEAIGGGQTFKDCTPAEKIKLTDAFKELLIASSTGFDAFSRCMSAAPLVENKCTSGASMANLIRNDDVLKVICYKAPANTLAEAYVNIRGEQVWIDHTFVTKTSPLKIASVIMHEIMHNRGFDHSTNDFGSALYANTVPEQARACLLNKSPNAWGGAGKAPSQTCPAPPAKECPAKQRCCERVGNSCKLCWPNEKLCP